ncbi:SDR family oxidoreductase [Nonomuraea turcica]|uniref:SDR family oxidoreductase n=1 Tax=Nonomuraea sp. G32 TaxID=3067274 RepID=UPI00273CAAC9|nr:SDR family oxidoreductase [Nonomuraea sp. G32]MDP4502185.1 SDR family oxidoreductase [Nonomuraea sp. G32]
MDLDGAFLCAQRAAKRMIASGRGGRIVNVTSVHEEYPRVGAGPYCAAKGGLRLLSRVLALELAEYGITVAPGEIAAVIAFLAGPAASYVTGATVYVDGGLGLMGPQAAGALGSGDWRTG